MRPRGVRAPGWLTPKRGRPPWDTGVWGDAQRNRLLPWGWGDWGGSSGEGQRVQHSG